ITAIHHEEPIIKARKLGWPKSSNGPHVFQKIGFLQTRIHMQHVEFLFLGLSICIVRLPNEFSDVELIK
ncbi:hypothetical protein PJP14_29905, partial [Mycobacterium kansasii]